MKDIIMPIAVLTAICLVCSAALAATYQTTRPVIEAAAAAETTAARAIVYEGATDLQKYTGELPGSATEIYVVNGGEGYVITAVTKGFGGPIEVMTGVKADGTITGIKILSMSETSGLGTQIDTDDYKAKYIGQNNVDNVDTIAGSTISSTAFKTLMQEMTQMPQQLSGGAN